MGWCFSLPDPGVDQPGSAPALPRESSSALPQGWGRFPRAVPSSSQLEAAFCTHHRHLSVGCDLIFHRGLLGMCLRHRVWGRTGKDVVACLIRKAIMKSGWRRGESSGSFLINPGSCWASSPSGMFRDAVCLNSLHLLMQ